MQRHLTWLGALVVLLTATGAYAQQQQPSRSVLDSYRKGVKAVEDKQWDAAITALNTAVEKDGRDRMWRESTLSSEPYFPHHYLFVAYLQAGNFAKAREN